MSYLTGDEIRPLLQERDALRERALRAEAAANRLAERLVALEVREPSLLAALRQARKALAPFAAATRVVRPPSSVSRADIALWKHASNVSEDVAITVADCDAAKVATEAIDALGLP